MAVMRGIRRWFLKQFLPAVAPYVAAFLVRALGATVRVTVHDREGLLQSPPDRPLIFGFWHNRLFLMPYFYRKYLPSSRRLMVMMSASRDGTMMSNIVKRFGIRAAVGSSSNKGISGMLAMIRGIRREGSDVAVTPDGPRGPRYVLKPGIRLLAQETGYSVIPITYHLESKWEIRSWDGFQIPKPFSRCDLIIQKSLPPAAGEETEWEKCLAEAMGC